MGCRIRHLLKALLLLCELERILVFFIRLIKKSVQKRIYYDSMNQHWQNPNSPCQSSKILIDLPIQGHQKYCYYEGFILPVSINKKKQTNEADFTNIIEQVISGEKNKFTWHLCSLTVSKWGKKYLFKSS